MNYRNTAVVSVLASLMAGCAYLPAGYSSRTGQGYVKAESPEKLFSSDPSATAADVSGGLAESTPALKVRKSKRGNMDSYVVRGQRYFTLDESNGYSARGLASWYGPNFHGRTASNGEVYDMYKMTAAHKTLPLPTYARVTHIDNGKSIIVKINDRGPFSGDRLIDLSFAAALELGMVNDGTAMVEIQALSAGELVAISGPKNTMGVDFYYDAGSEPRSATLPSSKLFVSDESADQNAVPAVEQETLAVPSPSDPIAQSNVLGAGSVSTTQVVPEGVVVAVPSTVETEYLEVVVPGRQQSSAEALPQVADLNAVDQNKVPVKLPAVALAANSETIPQTPEASLPLLDTVAVSPLAVAAVPAMVVPDKAEASSIRYYIQAGVYADVEDAEKIAVDIVLEVPEEEVHVKPLKDSHLYRITIGPIVSSEHAKEVADKLTETGLDNYTVKINEV